MHARITSAHQVGKVAEHIALEVVSGALLRRRGRAARRALCNCEVFVCVGIV